MLFEYDAVKSESNRVKHGISLDEAGLLWEARGVEVEARSEDEPRWLRIGLIQSRHYSCVFTVRSGVIRLISARRSRGNEIKIYEEALSREKENKSR